MPENPPQFAGDLFLTLAREGRLVVDADRAARLVADLEQTLARVHSRLRVVRMWQQPSSRGLDAVPEPLARFVVDAVFLEQAVPGQLERAAAELPKYIEALRRASAAP
jgi:hypothetical protein